MKNSNNLIIGTYFFKKFVDPKKQIYIPKNDFNVIKNLYSKNRPFKWNDVDIRIFHDGLDSEFIKKFSKKWIKFVYYDSLSSPYSSQDTKLNIALDYIKDNPHWDNIFIIDILCVKCKNNPFHTVERHMDSLFIANNKKLLKNNAMFFSKLEKINKHIRDGCLKERPELNSDIIGGKRNILIPFLENVCDLIQKLHVSYRNETLSEDFSILNNSIALNFASLRQNNILTDKPLFATNKFYQIHDIYEKQLLFTYK